MIDVSKLSGDTIKFGATVTLVDEDTDEKKVWQIVGEPEADAKAGRISITSPLARALIGKAKGAQVEVNAPGGAKAYEVKKVEWRCSGSSRPSRFRPGSIGQGLFTFQGNWICPGRFRIPTVLARIIRSPFLSDLSRCKSNGHGRACPGHCIGSGARAKLASPE